MRSKIPFEVLQSPAQKFIHSICIKVSKRRPLIQLKRKIRNILASNALEAVVHLSYHHEPSNLETKLSIFLEYLTPYASPSLNSRL